MTMAVEYFNQEVFFSWTFLHKLAMAQFESLILKNERSPTPFFFFVAQEPVVFCNQDSYKEGMEPEESFKAVVLVN